MPAIVAGLILLLISSWIDRQIVRYGAIAVGASHSALQRRSHEESQRQLVAVRELGQQAFFITFERNVNDDVIIASGSVATTHLLSTGMGLAAFVAVLAILTTPRRRWYSVASGGGGPGNFPDMFGRISSRRATSQDGIRLFSRGSV